MAYVSQEQKKASAPAIKALCKKFGVTGTLSVRHHSTLVLTLSRGKVDFIGSCNRVAQQRNRGEERIERNYIQVNTFWVDENYDGEAKEFLVEAVKLLKGPNYFDDSDPMTDYFNCSHYIDINVGKWDKPYILE